MHLRYLVTGAAGFIGSAFVRLINRTRPDIQVTVLDKLTYAGFRKNLEGTDSFFIKGDIANKELVQFILDQHMITHIVHFAAESHVDRSIVDPEAFINTNICGTKALLDCALKKKIKVLLVSTDEVYGSRQPGEPASKEDSPLSPRSPYAASKTAGDLLGLSYHTTYNLPVIITRGSNTFGPRQFPEKLIPLFATKLMQKESVPLMGDGGNIRDWLYVDDHCAGIQFALENGHPGQIYNIAGENPQTNKQIVDKLLQFFSLDQSYIKRVPHRLGHDFKYDINCDKLTNMGWVKQYNATNFEIALANTLQWYVDNPDWYKGEKK